MPQKRSRNSGVLKWFVELSPVTTGGERGLRAVKDQKVGGFKTVAEAEKWLKTGGAWEAGQAIDEEIVYRLVRVLDSYSMQTTTSHDLVKK